MTFGKRSRPLPSEFEYELELIDSNGKAQDLAGFEGAKVIDGPDVLLLRDKRVLRINITRQGNQSSLDLS